MFIYPAHQIIGYTNIQYAMGGIGKDVNVSIHKIGNTTCIKTTQSVDSENPAGRTLQATSSG